MTTCPRRKDAIDTDDDGKYVASKQCWNGCGGNHLVSDCKEPLCIKVIRMNEKAYFESQADGRDFIPTRREQVIGGERTHTQNPRASPAAPTPTPTIPVEFMTLEVRASCSWDGEKIGDLIGELATAPDVNIAQENDIETLTLSFSSEHELIAAQQAIEVQQDGNGEHFIVRRKHAPSTPCHAGATSSSTPNTQSGEAPWTADIRAIRTDHQKLEKKVNVMGNRITKLSAETDHTQAFMLEFAEFSGMTNARAVMAKCGKQDKQKDEEAKSSAPKDAEIVVEEDMEVDKTRTTGKRSTGQKSAETTCDATPQQAWAVVKLGNRHHTMHVEHVRTEERGNETHYLVKYENEEASMEHWVRSKDLFTSEPDAEAEWERPGGHGGQHGQNVESPARL